MFSIIFALIRDDYVVHGEKRVNAIVHPGEASLPPPKVSKNGRHAPFYLHVVFYLGLVLCLEGDVFISEPAEPL